MSVQKHEAVSIVERYQAGESIRDIQRTTGRAPSTIYRTLRDSGADTSRRSSLRVKAVAAEAAALKAQGLSHEKVAEALGFASKSSVTRLMRISQGESSAAAHTAR